MTAQPHIIRLRDPWQWLSGDGDATTAVSRWFHRPTRLEGDVRVVLTVADMPLLCHVHLNNRELKPSQPLSERAWTSDIGPQLQQRNLLQLEFNAAGSVDTNAALRKSLAAGSVRLEIHGGGSET